MSQVWETHAGTDTLELILHKEKPKYISSTYVQAVCDIWPQKPETHRTRLTTWGSFIDYTGEVSTTTLDLTKMKLHVYSVTSDIKYQYMCMDIEYLNLNNLMDKAEYTMIQIYMISQESII